MTRRLRLLHVNVQPILVWDDGDTLEPGPAVQAGIVTNSKLDAFPADLRAQVADLAAQIEAESLTQRDDAPAEPTDS